ncbi:hypothetical protein [Xanthobacter oligotrophicus]|uniref:hypothetical protein n=1 Tax=Xanthobacter oligotrophicus TaxID=2607286 RepID=UPI0011F2CB16|nr:hypothetical protein [Xanthobacter oligotrophicus]
MRILLIGCGGEANGEAVALAQHDFHLAGRLNREVRMVSAPRIPALGKHDHRVADAQNFAHVEGNELHAPTIARLIIYCNIK